MELDKCTEPAGAGTSDRFVRFARAMTRTLNACNNDEARILHEGTPHVADLIANDDWLPAHLAVPVPGAYGQYLLYRDPGDRFTTVAFVWDAGAGTPIHDHTVWGIVGVLRGAESAERFTLRDGKLQSHGEVWLERRDRPRVAAHRRHPSRAQRVRRSRLDQHPRLRRRSAEGPAPHVLRDHRPGRPNVVEAVRQRGAAAANARR